MIFIMVLDDIMRAVTKDKTQGIRWNMMEKLEDLDYADYDICLLFQRFKDMQNKIYDLHMETKGTGLTISIKQT